MQYGFITNLSYSSFGTTKSFTNFIILTKSDEISNNLLISNKENNNKRNIIKALTHEITHIFINEHCGIKHFLMDDWKQEGYCEYMSNGSSYDIQKGSENIENGTYDDSPSYAYFKYRLYITYLMDIKEMSFTKIIDSDIDCDELEKEIITYIKKNGNLF